MYYGSNGLFLKLCKFEVGGNFYKVIKSMYCNNSSQVRIDDKCTPEFPCNTGVRQGDTLSPTLFNIFINDLSDEITKPGCQPAKLGDLNIGCLFYADDLVILSESKNGLQNSMNELNSYCQKWHLTVNESKSKTMTVSNNILDATIGIKYGDKILEQGNEYKYLGTIISNDCSLMVAKDRLLQSATKAYYSLSNTLYSAKITNINVYLKLFDALVQPIMLYNCEIWGSDLLENKNPSHFLSGQKHMVSCEKLEMKMLKFLLGVPRGTSNVGVRSELLRLPVRFKITSQILKYYFRLKTGSKNQLLNDFFRKLCDLVGNPYSKFLTMLSDCEVNIQFPSSRNAAKTTNHKIYQSLQNRVFDTWEDEIIKNRKLAIFHTMKESFDVDPYLEAVNDRHTRKFLSFLRLSCHPLNIEYGRYKGIPKSDRLCKLCNLNTVEDEFHFLLSCPIYNDVRQKAFNNLRNEFISYNCIADLDKFKLMLQAPNSKIANIVCNYIKKCFAIRKTAIYK